MRRNQLLAVFVAVAIAGGASCSSDSETTDGTEDPAVAAADTSAVDPGGSVPNGGDPSVVACVDVPATDEIEAVVGVALLEGETTTENSCNFFGSDDSSNLVALLWNSDPVALSSFRALDADSGAFPIDDSELPRAMSQFGTVIYAQDDTVYSVSVLLVGVDAAAGTALAAEVLKVWLDR